MISRLLLLPLLLCPFLNRSLLFSQDTFLMNPQFISNLTISAITNGKQVVPSFDNSIQAIAVRLVKKCDEIIVNIYSNEGAAYLPEVLKSTGSATQYLPLILDFSDKIGRKKFMSS